MNNRTFIQSVIYFILLLIAVTIFKLLDLEVNFIITFIFTIFAISISVFFFAESNKILHIIKEKIIGIEKSIDKRWSDKKIVKDLNISGTSHYRRWR